MCAEIHTRGGRGRRRESRRSGNPARGARPRPPRRHPSDALAWIFAINTHHRYRGAGFLLPDLVRAQPDTTITDLINHSRRVAHERRSRQAHPHHDRLDLTSTPVLDDDERTIGIITIDDVVGLIAPRPDEDSTYSTAPEPVGAAVELLLCPQPT